MSDFDFTTAAETKPKRGAAAPASRRPPPASMSQASLPKEALKDVQDEGSSDGVPAEGGDKPKYDPDELARIFDEVIFAGEYSEEITIRSKLRVRFRTRTAEEIGKISMLIDGTTANLVATLSEKRSILNLQYALVGFSGRDLRPMSDEDKAKFVGRLPGPVIGALLSSLNDFDAKVYAACQDGEENF